MNVLVIASSNAQVWRLLRLDPRGESFVRKPVDKQECVRDLGRELPLQPGNPLEDWQL